MNLIDTHCHLTHPRLAGDTAAILERASAAGVVAVVCAAADLAESRAAAQLAARHPRVYCTAGLHPHEARLGVGRYLDDIEAIASAPGNVAIGEIGLDYHYNFSPPDQQRRAFAEQLALAARLGKPVVVHTREAFADTIAIIRDSGVDGRRVIFHSFTEGPDAAATVLAMGAYISFSGIVTFRNAAELRASAAMTPDDRLLVETDGPFLSPEPVRKMRNNEPANVLHVAECLAGVRGCSIDHVGDITTANARRLLNLS